MKIYIHIELILQKIYWQHGKIAKSSIIDYYTIVKNNEECKLNINKFVGQANLDAIGVKDDITIKAIRKNIYIDYETYEIQITNNSHNTVMLDDLEDTKNIYIKDTNNVDYIWFSYEYLQDDITILRGFTKNIFIKFNRPYKPTEKITNMYFSKIKLNNEKYIEMNIAF